MFDPSPQPPPPPQPAPPPEAQPASEPAPLQQASPSGAVPQPLDPNPNPIQPETETRQPAEQATEPTEPATSTQPPPVQPPARRSPPPKPRPTGFSLRQIRYYGRYSYVLLQEDNGPCPLLALCNILSLQGRLNLRQLAQHNVVSLSALTNGLAGFMMERLEQRQKSGEGNSAVRDHTVMEALEVLPSFVEGMDLNVGFETPKSYEASKNIVVLDACGVDLCHGWLVDGNDAETLKELRADNGVCRSYNAMIERCINGQAPHFATWLEENPTQLSYSGLFALQTLIQEDELKMFFRNNHFSVLTKRRNILYCLITDAGLVEANHKAVWESLEDVEGGRSLIVDENFGEPPQVPPPAPTLMQPSPAAGPAPPRTVVQAIPVQGGPIQTGQVVPARQVPPPPPGQVQNRPQQQAAYAGRQAPPQAAQQRQPPPPKKKKDDDSCTIS